MGNPLIDLVGPGGWEHGFIAVRPPATNRPGAKIGKAISHGAGTHTRRMSAAAARREGGSTKVGARLTMSEAANRASTKLSGRRASDFQHLGAARLHSAAARQAGISDTAKAHHTRMAAMHRGIASRNVGKQTAGERSAARERSNVFKSGSYGGHAARQDVPTLQKLARSSDPRMAEAARKELATRAGKKPSGPAALRAGETRAPSSGKAAGPNIGELGKAATGSHRLPKGSAALTKEGRAKAYAHGHALPPPPGGGPHGFPVTSAKSWEDARKAVGRAGSPARREQLKQLLRRTAAQYGKTAALKKSWAASNVRAALEFAVANQPYPITGPLDLIISRDPEDGSAVVRHRRGGGEVGRIKHSDDGQWRMSREGKEGQPHVRQRGALLELIGAHNHAAPSPYRRQPAPAAEPLQTAPQQTDLMKAYGIPATTSLATPAVATADGPRVTTGLGQRGQSIYKKLRGRGFPHDRAHSFARRAERKAAG